MKRYLAAAVIALGIGLSALPASAQVTVFHGQWLCDDRGTIMPLGGIETQLWRRGSPDFLPVEWVGGIADIGFANADGTFSLQSGAGEDNHFIRMALRDAAGVRLKDWGGINDWSVDLESSRNNVPDRDLFGRLFTTPGQSHKCAIWRGLHLAHRDFRDLTGVAPPTGGGGGLLIQADAPGETPLTLDVEVWWTPGYVTGYSGGGDDTITRHEFGHVIRHGYDGDATHFFGDVAEHTISPESSFLPQVRARVRVQRGLGRVLGARLLSGTQLRRPCSRRLRGRGERCGGTRRPRSALLRRRPHADG